MTPFKARFSTLIVAVLLGAGAYFMVQGVNAGHSLKYFLLFALYGVLAFSLVREIETPLQHVFLGCLSIIAGWLMFSVDPQLSILLLINVVIAIERLPQRSAFVWIGVGVVIVALGEWFDSAGDTQFQDGLIKIFIMLVVGGFAYMRKVSEQDRRALRALTQTLVEKNRQLTRALEALDYYSRKNERQKLSRELHDSVGHSLSVAIVQLEAASKQLLSNPQKGQAIVDRVGSLLRKGLEETRDLVHLLDADDKHIDFSAALSVLLYDFEQASQVSVAFNFDIDEQDLPTAIKRHVYRMVQEALTNVSRHAQATAVTVSIRYVNGLKVCIADNGSVLDAKNTTQLPALRSIKSRVDELHGSLKFERRDGLTQLEVAIPLNEQND